MQGTPPAQHDSSEVASCTGTNPPLMTTPPIPLARIERHILLIRGQKIMIDADLAGLYGVPTKRLNEQVKRNQERFPADFMFQLTAAEKQEVVANCDHLAKLKFSKTLPFTFTEHGAIQAANVLASPQAIELGVYVVRAFVHLRELVASNKELALRMDELDKKTDLISLKQQTFEQKTGVQLRQIIDALRELMAPPPAPCTSVLSVSSHRTIRRQNQRRLRGRITFSPRLLH